MRTSRGRARRTESTVLYDALGPRGRRRVLIATVLFTVVLVGFAAYFLERLHASGQLEQRRWSFVLDPDVLRTLWDGMLRNMEAAAIAGVLTLVLGLLLALGRLSRHRLVRWPVTGWIEFFRGFPALLLIVFPALLIPRYYEDIPALWYIVIGLTLYNSAVVAEIYRAGILSLDRGQGEAAHAIGLTGWQSMRLVILPQAIRRMVPLLLTQLIILFKDSTMGYIVSYNELLRRGETLGSFEPRVVFQAIIVTAVMFFLVSFVLSRGVALIEHRQRRRLGAAPGPLRTDAQLQKAGVV